MHSMAIVTTMQRLGRQAYQTMPGPPALPVAEIDIFSTWTALGELMIRRADSKLISEHSVAFNFQTTRRGGHAIHHVKQMKMVSTW